MKNYPNNTKSFLLSLIFAVISAFNFSGCQFYEDALRELKDADYDLFILAKALFSDSTPPSVTYIIPDSEASGVARNMMVSAIFSEDIDPMTVTPENFVVTNGSAVVDGTLRCVRNSVIFKPISNFEPNTPYDIVVHTGLKDRAGNALEEQFNWHFTTGTLEDTTAPTVILTSPADQTSAAPVNTGINVIFSESIDPATVTSDTFIVTRGEKIVTGQLSCMKNSITFRPYSDLAHNAIFHVTITTKIADLAGNAMTSKYMWDFTTSAARDTTHPRVEMTVPNDKAIDVDTDLLINIVFSETVDPSTVTTANLYVTMDGSPVTGTVLCSSNTAIFKPKAHLDADTSYRVTVTSRITDMTGNRMYSSNIFTFTTGNGPDATAPRVLSTIPGKYQPRVAPAVIVTAIFSDPVDSSTINESAFTLCTCGPVSCNECTPVKGLVNLDSSNTSATFTPSTPLPINKRYSARISTAVKDRAGNSMIEDYEWQFTTDDVPHNKSARIFFHDIDIDEGQIQGTVIIYKAADESDIQSYVLYWGSDENTKIGSALSIYPKDVQEKIFTFAQDTVPPAGAKYLLVYTRNDTGEMLTPVAYRAWDVVVKIVYDFFPGSYNGSNPSNLIVFNNKLYFSAQSNSGLGRELFVYDGVNNPSLVYDIYPSGSSNPTNFTVFNNKLYFQATDGDGDRQHGAELWVYDGVNNPTMLHDINPEKNSSNPSCLTVFNNTLYFQADDSEHGIELWAYDGINDPYIVNDIYTGENSSIPSNMIVFNNKLYFLADYHYPKSQLWEYDGMNIPKLVYKNSSGISNLILHNDRIYFSPSLSSIAAYDGISNPSYVYQNINISFDLSSARVFNNILYFPAAEKPTWSYGIASYDRITNTIIMYDHNPETGSSDYTDSKYLYTFNNKIFFQAQSSVEGRELWIFDGINFPYMVTNLSLGDNNSDPKNFCAYNNKLYFSANGFSYGPELWVYFEK